MKVCLLAAGRGTRNSSVKGLHKALLPLENKPAISHIIDKIPISTEIIIAVGYKSNQIKTYLDEVYPDRNIIFVEVDNYDKQGSGPGYSLLCCESYLNEPFVFTSIDTIIEENYPYIECNYDWIGSAKVEVEQSSKYCLIQKSNRGNTLYYGEGTLAYIGIAGVYSYEKFWTNLKNKKLINNEYQVTNGFHDLSFQTIECTWYDIGNNDSYNETKKVFSNDVVANKNNEALFIDQKKVVKFFDDTNRIKQRLNRTKYLPKTNVKLINENMYSYDYINGKLLSDLYDERTIENFFSYLSNSLHNHTGFKDEDFIKNCKLMYEEKTKARLKPLFDTKLDRIKYINGVSVKPIEKLIEEIDFKQIYDYSIPVHFHGDLQPENIIYNSEQSFSLIDWRESFGSSVEFGDLYYDLSKLYHGLLINGSNILKGHYDYEIVGDNASIKFLIKSNLYQLISRLKNFCECNNYSWSNVTLLGVIHYLNICNLYTEYNNNKYGNFLFLYGKYLLTNWMNQNG